VSQNAQIKDGSLPAGGSGQTQYGDRHGVPIKVADGNVLLIEDANNPLLGTPSSSSIATTNASATELLGVNYARRAAMIFNASAKILYLGGSGVTGASNALWTVAPNSLWVMPVAVGSNVPGNTGAVYGILAAADANTPTAKVTEYS